MVLWFKAGLPATVFFLSGPYSGSASALPGPLSWNVLPLSPIFTSVLPTDCISFLSLLPQATGVSLETSPHGESLNCTIIIFNSGVRRNWGGTIESNLPLRVGIPSVAAGNGQPGWTCELCSWISRPGSWFCQSPAIILGVLFWNWGDQYILKRLNEYMPVRHVARSSVKVNTQDQVTVFIPPSSISNLDLRDLRTSIFCRSSFLSLVTQKNLRRFFVYGFAIYLFLPWNHWPFLQFWNDTDTQTISFLEVSQILKASIMFSWNPFSSTTPCFLSPSSIHVLRSLVFGLDKTLARTDCPSYPATCSFGI